MAQLLGIGADEEAIDGVDDFVFGKEESREAGHWLNVEIEGLRTGD